MRTHRIGNGAGFLLAAVVSMFLLEVSAVAQDRIRIGIFDSRAVGLAYGRSKASAAGLDALRARHQAAKEKGDTEQVAKCEREGGLRQARMHDVVFGKGSVNFVLDEMKDDIAAIAAQEKLAGIVSTWELYQRSDVIEWVDITEKLLERLGIDEQARAMLPALRKTAPVKDAMFVQD